MCCKGAFARIQPAGPGRARPGIGGQGNYRAAIARSRTVRARSGHRRLAVAVALLVFSALAIGGLTVAALVRDHQSAHWDARLLPMVRFVEQREGHRFRRSVAVTILPKGPFQAAIGAGRPAAPVTLAETDRTVTVLRAFGVITGPVDLSAIAGTMTADSVIGLYDRSTTRIFVEGEGGGDNPALTAPVRATLVHELTHALQDQDGNLAVIERARNVPDQVARAVIEGDAVAAEQAYVATLSPTATLEYRAARLAQANQSASGMPAGLANDLSFPYLFGPAFATAITANGGTKGLDRAFHHPPVSEAEILDPARYLKGGQPKDARPFGQVSLFEVLGSRLGYRDTKGAVSGWASDRLILSSRNGRNCATVSTRFNTPLDADAFTRAAEQWTAEQPAAASATVSRQAQTVTLSSCDAGASASSPAPVQPNPYQVLAVRSTLLSLFVTQYQARPAAAACAADRLIDLVGPAALISYDQGNGSANEAAAIKQADRQATTTCGINWR